MIFGAKEKKNKKDKKKSKKKNTGKYIAIALIAAVLVGGGIFGAMRFAGGGSDEDAVYVQTVGELVGYGMNTVTRFSGLVENQKAEKIEADSSKLIKKIYVMEGDEVKKGDKLFEYSVESMELDLEQGQIEIEKLQNTVSSNEAQIAELQKERANAVTTADYLSIDSQIQELNADNNSTQYEIKLKKAELKQLKKTIKNAVVKSPIDGIIKTVAEQNAITDEDNALISIMAGNDIHIKGKINEVNIQDIFAGQEVVVRSRINPDETWNGKISEIVTDKTSDQGENMMYYGGDMGEQASSYDFYVELDSTEGLMMGQHLTIEPDFGQGGKGKEGIWLSSGYFMFDENDRATVWKDNGRGRLTLEKVTLGEYDEQMDEYEVVDGLTLEDKIAWPDERCKNGAKTTDNMIWNEDYSGEGEDFDNGMMYEDNMMGDDAMMDGEIYDESMVYDEDGFSEGVIDQNESIGELEE